MIVFLMHVQASPLLNEVLYDPVETGSDEAASEWVELCNPTEQDLDLSGWSLQRAGSGAASSWCGQRRGARALAASSSWCPS